MVRILIFPRASARAFGPQQPALHKRTHLAEQDLRRELRQTLADVVQADRTRDPRLYLTNGQDQKIVRYVLSLRGFKHSVVPWYP